tara:strand:- start:179 stop:523 length:345 start_codon:yes stop_codon:yes gene_type:complete
MAKPDFLDLDKDGDKKEPMKKAAREAKGRKAKQSKSESKDTDGGVPFDSLKEGAMRRQLKIPKDGKALTKTEVNRVTKVPDGEVFTFRDKEIKMTPLLKKRANLAKTMMGFKKK